ncbi:MAG: hypothetical protein ACJ74E_12530 [Actinomycetes bacterium]|jgi:hypothetical protein
MKNSLQKLYSFAGALILALGFAAPFADAQQSPPIKIGFSMGLTGGLLPGRQCGCTRDGNLAQ